jgi:hypothetical protein
MIYQSEAELRWLDHCEAALVRYRPRPPKPLPVNAEGAEVHERT